MAWVAIKTGIIGKDGQETTLRDYLCDWPDCAHAAEHVAGVVRELRCAFVVCDEHAALLKHRASQSGEDQRIA